MVIISRVSSINPVTCTIYLVPLQKGVYIKEDLSWLFSGTVPVWRINWQVVHLVCTLRESQYNP